MDTLFKRPRLRLRISALLAFFVLALLPVTSFALSPNDYPQTQSGQLAYCQALSVQIAPFHITKACYVVQSGTAWKYKVDTSGNGSYSSNNFSDYQPANPCLGMPTTKIYMDGKVLEGSSSCVRGPVQGDGSQAMCGLAMSPAGPPTWNPNSGGRWETYVTATPSASICAIGSGDQVGTVTGPPGGPTGPAAQLPPPIPDPVPASNPTPPKLCGGLSCYDAAADKFCAVVGGAQVCLSGDTARGGAGGCAVSGNGVICAGSPHAPTAPSPPINDPATQVKDNKTVTQADKATGAAIPVNVVVLAQPGTSVDSGQQAGDNGPAPPSSTNPPASSSYAGGGDCNSPPVCSGDAVMCGIARETWNAGCKSKKGLDQLHTDVAGTTPAPSLTDGGHTSADVWSDGTSTGNAIADAANAGSYDESGLGFATACPLHDMDVHLWDGKSFPIKFSDGCRVGAWIRALVIAFAFFAAARITMGGVG